MLKKVRAEKQDLEAQLFAILGSRFWRFTYPLRRSLAIFTSILKKLKLKKILNRSRMFVKKYLRKIFYYLLCKAKKFYYFYKIKQIILKRFPRVYIFLEKKLISCSTFQANCTKDVGVEFFDEIDLLTKELKQELNKKYENCN